ncbi:YceG family protein [Metabacillus sp. GX 13764]|uniref:YceG family protein n=1 Tax=Metabacillus kandeliae TaxID=2900151 RepID=UPI001E458821|nr:YceG family protein [Metabacillus kandeliae]MCD7034701.1 YceG family protein [Metabacillus kandeliae]
MNPQVHTLAKTVSEENWMSFISTPLASREGYKSEEQEIVIPHTAVRLLGTPYAEDEYFQLLYDLAHQTSPKIHCLSGELNKEIQQEKFQAIQNLLMIHGKEKLSINRFVAFMDRDSLLPMLDDPSLNRHIRTTFIAVLTRYEENHKDGLGGQQFRRVIVDLVKWTWNHLNEWLEEKSGDIPRVLWYGPATASEQYFLYLLFLFGCDLILVHPEGMDPLSEADPKQTAGCAISFPGTQELIPFPAERPKRKSTVAYKATKELDQVLHSDDSMLYKPWQFRNYSTNSITLKTTYDELFLLIREQAFVRPNFEVKNKTVYIPTLFSKIMGISKNRKTYWSKLEELRDFELSLVIRHFPFTRPVKGNPQFHIQDAEGPDGRLDPKRMMASNWWRYKKLPAGLQLALAEAISRYIYKPRLKMAEGESERGLQYFLFNHALEIPQSIISLLQNFDYAQAVPRLILYNNEQSGKLSRSDAAMLLLLNEFGIDIVLLNPAGYMDVEEFIEEKYFDIHWLDEMNHGEPYREATLFQKFIKRIF